MKLSMKLLKIVFLANLILLIFLYIFSKTFLLKNFTNIEIDKAHTDTNIVLNFIQRDLINLNSMTVDYARWDDTYDYINNINDEYISTNFDDTTSMERAKVNCLLIIDNLGNIVYKKDIKDETKSIFTEGLTKNITLDVSNLLSDNNTKNIMGIVQYDKNPILISAERITRSDGLGSNSPGIFIFVKSFDKDEIDAINENTQIQTELLPYDKDLTLNNDSEDKDTFIKVNNKESITGYGVLNDIFSKPTLLVKVSLQRTIFSKAENIVIFYFLILVAVLISFSLGIYSLIHMFVIKKINTLKSIVENVNSSQDLSTTITIKGNDEISELGFEFNNMFKRLKEFDERIITLAYYDTLTGLANRKKLLESVNYLLKSQDENFAFLFIDLDKFKSINDNLGHEAGDRVLLEVAGRLKNNTMSKDIVSRIGGDEFIVIIRDLKSLSSVTKIAEKLVKVLGDAFIYNDNLLYIGASVGISLFPEHGADIDTLIKNADLAMYEAKNNGGDGYTLYIDSMNDNVIDNLEMKKNLKNAIKKNEFIAYYQPIVDLKSMKILSAEALIRWKREGRIIPPMDFIPIAKKIGEIVEIDNWMLDNACAQCKKWQELGVKDFSVSVNISYKQLTQLNFVQLVMNILHKQSLDPENLNLEITEDEAMEDSDLIIKILSELKLLGIKISMDDFGTGYSSLSYLNNLPIDTLKIDRSLIINLENNPKNKVIIKSLVVIAHSLNIKVVAEGIETETQFVMLKELQCDFIQGYLIGKPMTESDFQDNFIK